MTSQAAWIEVVALWEGWTRRATIDGELVIGRAPDCGLVVPDTTASRRHARIRCVDGVPVLEDLDSRTGTWVDGRLVDGPQPLSSGATVQIAGVQLTVLVSDAPPLLSGDGVRDQRNLDLLLSAVTDLQALTDLDALLTAAVDRAVALARGDRGALLLVAGGGLELAVARDHAGRALATDGAWTRSLPRRALETRRAVLIPDTELGEEAAPHSVVAENLRAVLCVPVPGREGPLGVLYVDGQTAVSAFGAVEIAVMDALAGQVGLAIERARVREALERREREAIVQLRQLKARQTGVAPIGDSAGIGTALGLIRRVAPSDVTVTLLGETGTGKEILTRWLHQQSSRADGPLVVVDCGAIPEALIESELFGHARGAFTGAVAARPGRFREAHGGTLFLDEIGELPLSLQPRLLRVLQERTIQPVGATGRVDVDVRIVAATHRDLAQLVAEGRFREDLYYRLSVFTVQVPALRDRGDDVLLLAQAFLARMGGASLTLTHEARAALRQHAWPGNVRELENRVQRAVILARPPSVTAADLGLRDPEPAPETPQPVPWADEGPLPPLQEGRELANRTFEKAYLEEVLRRADGRIGAAVALAGISRQMLHRLMQRHDLDKRAFREGR